MDLQAIRGVAERLRQQVHRVVVGQDQAIDLLLVSLLSEAPRVGGGRTRNGERRCSRGRLPRASSSSSGAFSSPPI